MKSLCCMSVCVGVCGVCGVCVCVCVWWVCVCVCVSTVLIHNSEIRKALKTENFDPFTSLLIQFVNKL